MQLWQGVFASPIGAILLVWDAEENLRALDFHDYEARMQRLLRLHYGGCSIAEGSPPLAVSVALEGYFAGDFGALDGMRVETGGTPFQRDVWAALRLIPPGRTSSYGELAARIGRPAACRAVGAANGANPIAIVVPCHRVIGQNRSLTGFGGGLHRKAWLLAHEQREA